MTPLSRPVAASPRHLVVFISDNPTARTAKIGYGLRAAGIKVVLLHRDPLPMSEGVRSFDVTHRYRNTTEALHFAAAYKPLAYHVFASWNFDTAYYFMQTDLGPVVFDDYDVIAGGLKPEFIAANYPGLLEKERFCLEKADAITCRSLSLQRAKKTLGYQLPAELLYLPDCCWNLGDTPPQDRPLNGQDLHVAYVGNLGIEKMSGQAHPRDDYYFLDFAKDLAASGIHFHLYPSPHFEEGFENILSEHLDFAATTPYYHVNRPLPTDLLIKEISRFDLGLLSHWAGSTDADKAYQPGFYRYASSNKIFDYLDAGLGLVVGSRLPFIRWSVRHQDISICADLDHAKQAILSAAPSFWQGLRERVGATREAYSIARHAARLVRFYESLALPKESARRRPARSVRSAAGEKTAELRALAAGEANQPSGESATAPCQPMSPSADPSIIRSEARADAAGSHQAAAGPAGGASCLFVNTYYDGFITDFYGKNPAALNASYQEQLDLLRAQHFGDSDFYSRGLTHAGWQADDLIINAEPLQRAWAREQGCDLTGLRLVVEQIRSIRPACVYIQNLGLGTTEFLSAIRPHTELIVGQIAYPLPSQTDLSGFDIIVSSFPHYVERLRAAGITAYYQPLAFESRVLDRVTKFPFAKRPIDCSFVGGISPAHGKGYHLLENLAAQLPIDFWGYGAEMLPPDSHIKPRHHGEVWGSEMFYLMGASKVTINRHIDVAENNANNMRLYEATGCGALLITDLKDNLHELFEIGKEVVAYRTPEECMELVRYYLAHPEEAEKIARAGQARTLKDHAYKLRMQQTAKFLSRHLKYRREADTLTMPQRISDGHRQIGTSEVTDAQLAAWKDPGIPAQQRALVQKQLEQMYHGVTPQPFQILGEMLSPLACDGLSVLELGCASGYYYEVLEYLLKKRVAYTGVDYSEAMIRMAREYYPDADFLAADGAQLPFADRSFRVAVSGCVLLHTPEYARHIAETARVADQWVVLHRTPVSRVRPTLCLSKMAYGVETVEFQFNEQELLGLFREQGFQVARAITYYENPQNDSYETSYLLERVGR